MENERKKERKTQANIKTTASKLSHKKLKKNNKGRTALPRKERMKEKKRELMEENRGKI